MPNRFTNRTNRDGCFFSSMDVTSVTGMGSIPMVQGSGVLDMLVVTKDG